MPAAPPSVNLSERVRRLKPSATLAVTARVAELKAAGHDVIGFGAGQPDFDTADVIKAAAIAAIQAGRTGYEPVPGTVEARDAIADKFRTENGITCTPDDVVISAGAKHSLYLALQAVVDPGREVVVPTPAWVSYRPMIELCGGTAVEVPGAIDNDFRITAGQLEEAITPNTAVIVLNSPSNPCGTMYAPDDQRELAEVIARHEQLIVISDEIYEKLVYGGVPHFSMGSLPALADRVITINGMSKAFAMTGWRLGYACAPGHGIARAMARLQGQMTTHATSFCYPAIVTALQDAGDDVERMRQVFAERATLIHGLLTAIDRIVCPRPTGAFYVFPDISAHLGRTTAGGRLLDSGVAFAEALLEEAMVAVVPGADFGACAAGHMRMSFACGREQIEEGCRRLAEFIARLT